MVDWYVYILMAWTILIFINSNLHILIYLGRPTSLSAVLTNSTAITVYWSPPPAAPTEYEISVFANRRLIKKVPVKADSTSGCKTSSRAIEIGVLDTAVTYSVSMVAIAAGIRSKTTGPVVAGKSKHNITTKVDNKDPPKI